MSTAEDGALLVLSLVVNVVTNGLLCICGYIGNVLTIIVLSKDKAYNSNTFLMQILAGYDIFFLTHTLLYTVLRSVYPSTGLMKEYFDKSPYIVAFVLPFGWIAQTGTIWFTTALAADRYIGITRPFKALTMCSVKNAKKATVGLSILALLFNLPRFFYYFNVAVNSRDNSTFIAHVRVELPGFDANLYRYIYHITLTFIFLYIIPLTMLSVLNYQLIKTLRLAGQNRKRMSMMRNGSPTKQNLTITFNLVIVISKFILCETPDFISSIIGAVPNAADKTEYKMFNTIKEMLLVFNSAVNFYIYCIFNSKFRENLRRTLPCCKARKLDRGLSTSTSTLNVSLSSLTLAISAFKGTRTSQNTQPTTEDTDNERCARLRRQIHRSASESSGELLDEAAASNRSRLYSAESNDTILTVVSSEMQALALSPHAQSDNPDYLVFNPQAVYSSHLHLQRRASNHSLKGFTNQYTPEVSCTGYFQCENEDYVVFKSTSMWHISKQDTTPDIPGDVSDIYPSNTQQTELNNYISCSGEQRSSSKHLVLPDLLSSSSLIGQLNTNSEGGLSADQSENPDFIMFRPKEQLSYKTINHSPLEVRRQDSEAGDTTHFKTVPPNTSNANSHDTLPPNSSNASSHDTLPPNSLNGSAHDTLPPNSSNASSHDTLPPNSSNASSHDTLPPNSSNASSQDTTHAEDLLKATKAVCGNDGQVHYV